MHSVREIVDMYQNQGFLGEHEDFYCAAVDKEGNTVRSFRPSPPSSPVHGPASSTRTPEEPESETDLEDLRNIREALAAPSVVPRVAPRGRLREELGVAALLPDAGAGERSADAALQALAAGSRTPGGGYQMALATRSEINDVYYFSTLLPRVGDIY